ncbi:proline dehydrogenase family protein [bacterium]|nr:proline dehydrogenase family protein [bacterium]
MPSLLDKTIAALLPAVPKPLVRKFSSPYIAGEEFEDAARISAELRVDGIRSTMDILGEHVSVREQALTYTEAYLELIQSQDRLGLDRNVSIKLSMLGLTLDKDFCLENMNRIMACASSQGTKIRIDMEDSSCTDDTLWIYRTLRAEHNDIGVVLQAYLHRSMDDVKDLADLNPDYRLCKGIYIESPKVAIQDPVKINENFLKILEAMWDSGSYVGVATHDEKLIEKVKDLIRARGLGPERYEFQMLLGVQARLRDSLVAEGHPLRIYIPFGRDWYAYSLRRLKENPAVAGHVLRSMFRG